MQAALRVMMTLENHKCISTKSFKLQRKSSEVKQNTYYKFYTKLHFWND